MNQTDYLSQCHEILTKVIKQLNCQISDNQINEISKLIVDAMGGHYRHFHNFEHLLMVSNSNDPLVILAGIFHDLIYVQVDKRIVFNVSPYLTPFIEEKNGLFLIKSTPDHQENVLDIVLEIFQVNRGDNLSDFVGRNEFLSALSAATILVPFLSLAIIARLVTIIELTIPFRRSQADDISIIEKLKQRLESVNYKFKLDLDEATIKQTITQAVKLANLDVSGFAFDDVRQFVNNTWLLLPETNHSLLSLDKSTLKEYCIALTKTAKFLDSLSPELIFHRYNDEPVEETWHQLLNRCQNNLAVTKLYLTTIIVSLSLVEALCCRFTHQISFSFLFGFSLELSPHYPSLNDFLTPQSADYQAKSDLEAQALYLIASPPPSDFLASLSYSFLVDFVVRHLGFETIENFVPQCYLFLENKINHEELITLFPDHFVTIIIDAIASLLAQKQQAVRTVNSELSG